jgi:hypothetical protein
MRQTGSEEILSAAYPARIEIVEALREAALGGKHDAVRLRTAANELYSASGLYGEAPSAALFVAIGDLAQCICFLLEWRAGVLNATPDAARFVTAARERATAWLKDRPGEGVFGQLLKIAEQITGITSVNEVGTTAAALAAVSIPVGLYSEHKRQGGVRIPEEDDAPRPRPAELTVAFLRFTIDGKPVDETSFLSPGEVHDLDIEVRVSRWPVGATALILEPVTTEHADAYKMPIFMIPAPAGTGPFQLREQGRAVLTIPNHFNARPFEFKYLARFEPRGSEQPVETVGQRTLLLEGVDLARHPLTGFEHVDRKLMDIRNNLRVSSFGLQKEVTDVLALAIPLANLAAQSVADNVFDAPIAEDEFQKRVRSFLRSQPTIGSGLEEHPRAAGGITDLSFRGIRLELKSEQQKCLAFADCEQFVEQAASYAIGSGKRLAVLCVLDCSPKTKPAFPIEDGIGLLVHQATNTSVYVLTILIQGNLAKPSDFSRKRKSGKAQ